MMTEGWSDKLEVLGIDGVRNYVVWLENTDVSNPGVPILQSTDDPWWQMHDPVNNLNGRVERLEVIAHGGDHWTAKVRCQFYNVPPGPGAGPQIICWYEFIRTNGEDAHDDNYMMFLDWNSNKWIATLGVVRPPFPGQPQFHLQRV